MDIERITGKLLTQHNCVIIPGFGGFIANPKGAAIHPGRHTFAPPYKAILFNRSLTANDGLLANALVLQHNITYSEAVARIEQFVRQTDNALRNRNKVVFAELGFLQADFEGNINFTQDHSVNYLYDSFGLDEFQSLPIDTKTTTRREQPKVDRVIQHPARTVKSRKSPKSIVAALGFVLIVALASTIIGIGATQADKMAAMAAFFSPATDAENCGKLVEKTVDKNVMVAPVVVNVVEARAVVVVPEGIQPEAKPEVVQPQAVPAKIIMPVIANADIHIIAASYAEKEKAEKYADKLKAQGFDTFIIDKKGNDDMYKVGIASFYSLNSAKEYIGLLQAPLNAKAWIYTEK